MDISQIRAEYSNTIFTDEEFYSLSDPFILFDDWFKHAIASGITEAHAMCLSTCSIDNKPSSRYVLLKSFDKEGFVFYSNYESRKGRELKVNPNACINFYWQSIHRQIRIEGIVEQIPESDSVQYFNTRSKLSQASAFVSKQSQVVSSRSELETRFKECLDDHITVIPKPACWGGYKLKPFYFEFWQGHTSRLHDRVAFTKQSEKSWNVVRLYP